MPFLAAMFMSLSTELARFFWGFMSKRLAFGLAAVVIFGSMTALCFGILAASLEMLVFVLPSWPGMQIAVWVATPPAVPAGVSIALSTDAAVALYRWNVTNLKLISGTTVA